MAESKESPRGQTWTVTGQIERTVISPGGTPQDVIQVTYRLADGTTGTVQVPAANYGVDAVRRAIIESASVRSAVANLTG